MEKVRRSRRRAKEAPSEASHQVGSKAEEGPPDNNPQDEAADDGEIVVMDDLDAEEGQLIDSKSNTVASLDPQGSMGLPSPGGKKRAGKKKGSKGAPWSCSTCTLLNSAAGDECEACGAPKAQTLQKKEGRSPHSNEAGPSDVPGGPDWACVLCTFQNRYAAEECEMCAHRKPAEGPSPITSKSEAPGSSPQANGSAEQPGLGMDNGGEGTQDWTCAFCTFQNRSLGEVCDACARRKSTETPSVSGSEPQALRSVSSPLEDSLLKPQGDTVAESSSLGLNRSDTPVVETRELEPPASEPVEAGTGGLDLRPVLGADVAPEVSPEPGQAQPKPSLFEERAGPSVRLQCGICSSDQTLDTFCLDGCSHRFCTACLRGAVQSQLAALPPSESATVQQVSGACVCPNAGCKTPLTQRDLILTAGEERAHSHQQWLYQVLTREYTQEEGASVKCASCGEEQHSRVKLSQLGTLSLRDLRRALKVRGLNASGKHPECAQRLADVFSGGAGSNDESWICFGCPERNCATCGLGLGAAGYDCQLATWSTTHRAVAELDKAFKAYINSTTSPPPLKAGKKQKTSHKGSNVWAAGTGYGGASDSQHHHHYYWGGKHGKHKQPPQPPAESAAEKKAKEAEREADTALGIAMDALIACLSGGAGDGLVAGLSLPLVALVHESGVPARVLRALLLNDSMIDVSNRGGLYLKALQLMRVLGAREELLPVICESPPKRPKDAPKPVAAPPSEPETKAPPAEEKSLRRSGRREEAADKKGKRKVEEPEDDVTVREASAETRAEEEEDEVEGTVLGAMEKLYKQASVVKVGLMGGAADESGSDELDIGLVCEICDAFEELQRAKKGWEEARGVLRNAQGLGGLDGAQRLANGLANGLAAAEEDDEEDCVLLDRRRRKGKAAEAPEASAQERARARNAEETAYKNALEDLQFRMESLVNSAGKPDHYFRSAKNAIDTGGVHSQKRMLAISKEIGSLVTTLPLEWGSSVHVRVDEERMDLVKALIIGPGGTPYQNGAFLFDILLPPDYPQVSPKVQFMTTGGGRTRFNPNLYADGKVCLSILGTWAGPGWQPGKSTLMQVLLSIQGMIFVPEPYFNEPGYESHGNKTASHNYTRNQRRNTLQLAVLGMLRNPPAVFADVIRTHFKLKRREIEAQCEEWAPDDFAPQPAAKPKGKQAPPPPPKKKKQKEYAGDSDMSDWDSDDEDKDEFLLGMMDAVGMGEAHIDHESGRGGPIEVTKKEILAELGKL